LDVKKKKTKEPEPGKRAENNGTSVGVGRDAAGLTGAFGPNSSPQKQQQKKKKDEKGGRRGTREEEKKELFPAPPSTWQGAVKNRKSERLGGPKRKSMFSNPSNEGTGGGQQKNNQKNQNPGCCPSPPTQGGSKFGDAVDWQWCRFGSGYTIRDWYLTSRVLKKPESEVAAKLWCRLSPWTWGKRKLGALGRKTPKTPPALYTSFQNWEKKRGKVNLRFGYGEKGDVLGEELTNAGQTKGVPMSTSRGWRKIAVISKL